MDVTALKTALAAQDQAYRSALELFLNQINENMKSLQTTVTDLTTSLEFSQGEIADLKKEVEILKEEKKSDEKTIRELTEGYQNSQKLIKDMEDRCNYQEDYSRRNNLQIIGVEEQAGETWEQTAVKVSKLLEEKMELPNMQLERAHRVGRKQENRKRPIIARFSRFCDREAAVRNAKKLRGTSIYINEDLCQASQEIRKMKLPLLKQARKEGKIAYFVHTKLVIKEKGSSGISARSGGGVLTGDVDFRGAVGSAGAAGGARTDEPEEMGVAGGSGSGGTVARDQRSGRREQPPRGSRK